MLGGGTDMCLASPDLASPFSPVFSLSREWNSQWVRKGAPLAPQALNINLQVWVRAIGTVEGGREQIDEGVVVPCESRSFCPQTQPFCGPESSHISCAAFVLQLRLKLSLCTLRTHGLCGHVIYEHCALWARIPHEGICLHRHGEVHG